MWIRKSPFIKSKHWWCLELAIFFIYFWTNKIECCTLQFKFNKIYTFETKFLLIENKMHMERVCCCSVCIQRETRILTKLVVLLNYSSTQHRKRNTKCEACTSERAPMRAHVQRTHLDWWVGCMEMLCIGWLRQERSVRCSCM